MKPIKRPLLQSEQNGKCRSAAKSRPNKVYVTLVSDEERNLYRVPSYGYILP